MQIFVSFSMGVGALNGRLGWWNKIVHGEG